MANSSEKFQPPNVPIFNGENFRYWSKQLRLFFVYQDLWDVVEDGVPTFSEYMLKEGKNEIHEASKRDAKALFCIRSWVSSAILETIAKAKSSKEAWDQLKRLYEEPEEVTIDIPLDPAETAGEYSQQPIRLYRAAFDGDWGTAKHILHTNPEMIRARITMKGDTALHIAAAKQRKEFVVNLVESMEDVDLVLRNNDNNTAICFAAMSGSIAIAEAMVNKNPELLYVRGKGNETPIQMAAAIGHKGMVRDLYEMMDLNRLERQERQELFLAVISSDIFDVALKIIYRDRLLALARGRHGMTALHMMAKKGMAVLSGSDLPLFNECLQRLLEISGARRVVPRPSARNSAVMLLEKLWDEVIRKLSPEEMSEFFNTPSRMFFDAAALGNNKFLEIASRYYPDMIWEVDSNNNTLFHVAAMHRQTHTLGLIINGFGYFKYMMASSKDERTGDNTLHQMARMPLPPNPFLVKNGPIVQMQMEFGWFEVLRSIAPASYQYERNKKGELPHDIFLESHRDLMKEADREVKGVAGSSMLATVLIATVAFAAALTVPGGNNDETGIPTLRKRWLFNVFVLADAAALFTSTISMLIFLSILVPRYQLAAVSWFNYLYRLEALLLPLVLAIISMIITFVASLLLIYDQKEPTMQVLISVPAILILLVVSCVLLLPRIRYLSGLLGGALFYRWSIRAFKRFRLFLQGCERFLQGCERFLQGCERFLHRRLY